MAFGGAAIISLLIALIGLGLGIYGIILYNRRKPKAQLTENNGLMVLFGPNYALDANLQASLNPLVVPWILIISGFLLFLIGIIAMFIAASKKPTPPPYPYPTR